MNAGINVPWVVEYPLLRHGRARPGHPRGSVSGQSKAFPSLHDVGDRDKPGHDGAAR